MEKENKKYETYCHLLASAQMRGNIIRWYPVKEGQNILLVSEMDMSVVETVLRTAGAQVTAIKNSAFETWLLENPKNTFDVIFQIGILEAEAGMTKETWKKRFAAYQTLLKSDGTLLLTAPNRLGLKYFAGCQDENYDSYFTGPMGYTPEMTKQALSRREYETLLEESGFVNSICYYPYPDYLFPAAIFSDEYLPQQDELNDNIRNFDKDRYVLFDETKVYNSLLKENLFGQFSNAFFFVSRAHLQSQPDEKVLYSKFSMERDEKFQIRTDIVKKKDGTKVVRKYPLTPEAALHVAKLEQNYQKLQQNAEGTGITFCPVRRNNDAAEFPWVRGESLQQRIQQLLESGEEDAADRLIVTYIEKMKKIVSGNTIDVDLIFPNILADGENWTVIDYEWSFEADIPEGWVIYRTLFYLAVQLRGYELTNLSHLLGLAEITEKQAAEYADMETKFQAYLKGNAIPMSHRVDMLGKEVIPFAGNIGENEKETIRQLNHKEKDARKIFYHLDCVEKRDGKAVVCGWACAKTRKKEWIPVHVTLFDQMGNPVGRKIERTFRMDVANVLKADCDFPYWGFSISFGLCEENTYTLRLCAGKCQYELALAEISEKDGERN